MRLELLRSALRYYEEFLALRGHDAGSRADAAATHVKVAQVVQEVGKIEDALAAYERGIGVWRELLAESPERREFRRQLTMHYFAGSTVALSGAVQCLASAL